MYALGGKGATAVARCTVLYRSWWLTETWRQIRIPIAVAAVDSAAAVKLNSSAPSHSETWAPAAVAVATAW